MYRYYVLNKQLACALYTYIHNETTYVVALMDRHLHTAFGAVYGDVQCCDQTNSIHYLIHCIYPQVVYAMPVFRSPELSLKKPHKTGHKTPQTWCIQCLVVKVKVNSSK